MFTKAGNWKRTRATLGYAWFNFHGCQTSTAQHRGTTKSFRSVCTHPTSCLYYSPNPWMSFVTYYTVRTNRPFDQVFLEIHSFHLSQVDPEITENFIIYTIMMGCESILSFLYIQVLPEDLVAQEVLYFLFLPESRADNQPVKACIFHVYTSELLSGLCAHVPLVQFFLVTLLLPGSLVHPKERFSPSDSRVSTSAPEYQSCLWYTLMEKQTTFC